MKNKINLMMSILLTSLILISCAKDGATGPQGPAGSNGTNGNANVISKAAQTVSFVYSSTLNTYDAILSCPEITQDVVDKGVVLCYERVAPNQWMPWNYSSTFVGHTYYIFNFRLGEIVLQYFNANTTTTNEGDKTMRFVIIPSQDVPKLPKDLSDLTAVTKALGIN